MVKQSRIVTGFVSRALQVRALGETKLPGWKGLGRATGLVAVGLVAAIAAPRAAHANVLFQDYTTLALTPVVAGTAVPQACADTGDPGCYTNWLQFADVDSDGDFDIVMANGGGLFTTGNSEELLVYTNDGKASFQDVNIGTFNASHGQSRMFAVGDIDGDGDIDIYMPGGYGVDTDKLWVNVSPITATVKASFEDHASTLLPAGLKSNAAAVKLGDLDGDGDLDLVVADWGTGSADSVSKLVLYFNDGHGVFTQMAKQDVAAGVYLPATIPATATAPYYGARPTDIDFADVDGDFDLDILINHREGYSRIFLNDGHGKFTDGTAFTPTFAVDGTTVTSVAANYPPKQGPFSMTQELCDLDEDGDLDLVLDNAGKAPAGAPAGGGTNVSQLLFNDGHGVFTDLTATRVVGEPTSIDGTVKCADVNGDGHYDLVVGSRTHTSEKVLLNNAAGTGTFTYAADALPKFTDLTIGLDVGDLNGDGKLDMMTGQGEGTSAQRLNRVYTNIGTADSTAPVFRAIQTPVPVVGVPTKFRIAVRDSATNDFGQMVKSVSVSYALPGKTAKVAKAVWVGGDLFSVTIPAQADGVQLTLTPTAVDRHDLTKLGTPIVLQFGTAPMAEGGAGGEPAIVIPVADAGAAGEAPVASEAGAGGETAVEAGGTGGKTSTGGKGGTTSAAGKGMVAEGGESAEAGEGGKTTTPASSDDNGCSCSMVPATQSRSAVLLGFGLAMLGLVRRRRNK